MLIVLPQGILSNSNDARVRDFIHREAEIRAIISLPRHTFSPSGVPMVNTCVVLMQKHSEEKKADINKALEAGRVASASGLKGMADFDYPIFMGIVENVGYDPSGRVTARKGQKTDLDLVLDDFFDLETIRPITTDDVLAFAKDRYGEHEPTNAVAAKQAHSKSSFIVPFSETSDRLDPPFYLVNRQAADLLASLQPLGKTIVEKKGLFKPATDVELDSEYRVLSVSNDGRVSLSHLAKGEDFTRMRRVETGDIVYNPMRINIGSVGVVPDALSGGLVSPDYVVFSCRTIDPDFLVALLRSPFYRMYIDVSTTGSIRNRLYFEGLQLLRVPETSPLEQSTVRAMVEPANMAYAASALLSEHRLHVADRLTSLVRQSVREKGKISEAFRALADRWIAETAMLSSVTRKIRHPAYRKIIDLGEAVVPLILREMASRPSFWFSALEELTGDNPAQNANGIEAASEAWLKWGRDRGRLETKVSYH